MKSRAIITSASNKFFPSVLNLIGSIKNNYPNHPPIYVYDLGLFYTFRKELETTDGVEVIKMPKFCSFWRKCYTWKTYIFTKPLADLNFYMDAGSQVESGLDELFDSIEKDGYFFVEQETLNKVVMPLEYYELFNVKEETLNKKCVACGMVGFNRDFSKNLVIKSLYNAAVSGLGLGFSEGDQWRNKGVNKSYFVRNCDKFRHDTTLLNLALNKYLPDFKKHSGSIYASLESRKQKSDVLIWNLRLAYTKLSFIKIKLIHKKSKTIFIINRAIINLFILLRKINFKIKKINYEKFGK